MVDSLSNRNGDDSRVVALVIFHPISDGGWHRGKVGADNVSEYWITTTAKA